MRARSAAIPVAFLLLLAGALGFLVLQRSESEASGGPIGPAIQAPQEAAAREDVDLRAPEVARAVAPERAQVQSEPEPVADNRSETAHSILVGRVVDQAGRGVAGAELRLERRGLAAHSDPDGSFRLALALTEPEDTLHDELHVVADGFAQLERNLTLTAGEQDLGELALTPGGRVSGRVVDGRGYGLEGARVVAIDSQDARPEHDVSGPWNGFVESKSDAQGRFLLRGVPAGELRVTAGMEGWYWSTSQSFELTPLEEHRDIELVLAQVPDERWIVLRVLDPGGLPVPGAPIDWSYQSSYQSGTSSGEADDQGEYRLVVHAMGPHAFTAHDPQDRYRSSSVDGVAPGTRGLVLQLGERRELVLTVRDREGKVVKAYQATVASAGPDRTQLDTQEGGEDGRSKLSVPGQPFMVSVVSEGFDLLEQGPFQPESPPEALEIVLTRLPGVHGIVRHGAEALRGARVGLHEAVDDSRLVVNGFLARSRIQAEASGTTAADGRFALTLRQAGSYYLRAEAEGLAPAEIGPLDLDPAVGAQGLELVLGAGGAIEGRVLMPPGESAANVIVGISRADGKAVTQRSDASGRFGFERLMPGEWYVTRAREEITPNRTGSSWGGDPPDRLPFNCNVREGEVTSFDLDLTAVRKLTLEGRFRLGGQPAAAWRALLQGPDFQEVSGRESLDASGRFTITVEEPGEYWLRLVPGGEPGAPTFSAQVRLESERTSWERDVPVGSLTGGLAGWLLEGGGVTVGWSGDGLSYWGGLLPDANGRYRLDPVPAGQLHFNHWNDQAQQVLKTVTLASGASLPVDLP